MCKEHNALLESKFQKSANWTKAEIHEMTRQLQIPYIKIYKWNWERKKKELATQTTASDAQDAQSSGQE